MKKVGLAGLFGHLKIPALLVVGLLLIGLIWDIGFMVHYSKTWLALKTFFLLAVLPNLWLNSRKTQQLLSLLIWVFFVEAVVGMWSQKGYGQFLAFMQLVVSLILFLVILNQVKHKNDQKKTQ